MTAQGGTDLPTNTIIKLLKDDLFSYGTSAGICLSSMENYDSSDNLVPTKFASGRVVEIPVDSPTFEFGQESKGSNPFSEKLCTSTNGTDNGNI